MFFLTSHVGCFGLITQTYQDLSKTCLVFDNVWEMTISWYTWGICFGCWKNDFPANSYLFKVNNRSTRKRCYKCSDLTLKAPERRGWRRSGVFIVNFEHTLHLFLMFLLLILKSNCLLGSFYMTKIRQISSVPYGRIDNFS